MAVRLEQAVRAVQSGWEGSFARRARAGVGGEIVKMMALSGATDVISFSGGFPDPSTFAGQELAHILSEVADDPAVFQYAPTAGLPGMRAWLADRLERLEGRAPAEEELIVTSGGIEGLELLGKSLVDQGDVVAVEAPSYLGAIMGFRSFEADVVGIDIDDQGLDIDATARLFAERRPKFLYTIPDHQNPAGVSMATDRRQALVELARRYGVLLVEDVAYRELGFAGERRPSLWRLAPDVTAQLGTFSKVFTPGFRMGWVAGPAAVVAQLVLAKQNTDQCTGALGQRLLEEYGRRGQLDRSIAAARQLYQRRCQALLGALEEHLPDQASYTRPEGGFFCWVTAGSGVDTTALVPLAREEGVAFVPGQPFYPDGRGANQLRLSYSKVDDQLISSGVERLGRILSRAGRGR
jgi:2-aminoadipate transaminase